MCIRQRALSGQEEISKEILLLKSGQPRGKPVHQLLLSRSARLAAAHKKLPGSQDGVVHLHEH